MTLGLLTAAGVVLVDPRPRRRPGPVHRRHAPEALAGGGGRRRRRCPLAVALVRGSAAAHRAPWRGCCSAPSTRALRERVEELTVTRAGAVDAAAAELAAHRARPARRRAGAAGRAVDGPRPGRGAAATGPARRRASCCRGAQDERPRRSPSCATWRAGIAPADAHRPRPRRGACGRSPPRCARCPATRRRSTSPGRLPAPVEIGRLLRRRRGADERRQARAARRARVVAARASAASVLAVEVADDGRGGADPAGTGLAGLRRRRRGARRHAARRQPAGRPDGRRARSCHARRDRRRPRAAARRPGAAARRATATRSSPRSATATRSARVPRAPARRRRRRRPAAADLHRRGPARRARGAPARARACRCSCSPSTSSGRTPPSCWPTAGAASATCSRTGSPTRAIRRRRAAGRRRRHGARPRGRSPSSSAAAATARSAELTPREREVLALMAEGRSNAAIAERAGRHARAPSRSTSRASSASSTCRRRTPTTAASSRCWPGCATIPSDQNATSATSAEWSLRPVSRTSWTYSQRRMSRAPRTRQWSSRQPPPCGQAQLTSLRSGPCTARKASA